MKEWEKRYLHEKAVRDAYCEAEGIPIPQNEQYGVLKRLVFTAFHGKLFWPILNEKGHDKCEFEKCRCMT
jgi:hypothetical protein